MFASHVVHHSVGSDSWIRPVLSRYPIQYHGELYAARFDDALTRVVDEYVDIDTLPIKPFEECLHRLFRSHVRHLDEDLGRPAQQRLGKYLLACRLEFGLRTRGEHDVGSPGQGKRMRDGLLRLSLRASTEVRKKTYLPDPTSGTCH